uniref:DekiORF72 n=1 Tax=Dendrolimus kikuchii nucleopolyhedrovirus TaxID=1219875 RepID=V9LSY6_9ABAC|nr:DekiORF72 [Dendrolimus kikuchii nucleopolyhedrovirus]
MASITSSTPDIVVNVEPADNDVDVLNFIIGNEYHLKRLGIGAHAIKVISSPHLERLHRNHYCTISCGTYAILCNLVHGSEYDVETILFNRSETRLDKGGVLFKTKIYNIYKDLTEKNGSSNGGGGDDDDDDDGDGDASRADEHVIDTPVSELSSDSNMGEAVDDASPPACKKQKFDDIQQD